MRHADFLTSLTISVVGWRSADATRRFCAVRRGVLSVTGGTDISVATREAIVGDDLATLDQTVLVDPHALDRALGGSHPAPDLGGLECRRCLVGEAARPLGL